MTKRNPFKGRVIAKVIAQTGCTYEQADVAYVELFEKRILKPAVRIMAGMAARQAYREVMGRDLSENN